MAATTYLQELISQGSNSKLKTAYVGLWVGNPGVGGSVASEVSAGEYSRQLVSWDPGQLLLTNDTTITWAQASSHWGFITHVALCDSLTGVNVLVYQALSSPVEVPTGSTVTLAPSDLNVVIT